MRINYILPSWVKAGGFRIIIEYANRLQSKGYDVKLYYPKNGYDFYKGQFKPIYKVKRRLRIILKKEKKYEYDIFNNQVEVLAVKKINDKNIRDADFTIATAWPTAYDVVKLNFKKGKKIYFIQDYEIFNSNIKLVDLSYKLPINKITICNFLRDFLYNKFSMESEVILNGINYNIFDYKYPQKKDDNLKILFVYYPMDRKNMPLTLEIINRIKNKYHNVEINSFGFNKDKDLPDFVNFYLDPDESTIVKLYNQADIFLFTSKFEGFGLPPAEAMACKTAVVTSNVGAIPDYAEHMKTAYIVNNLDPNEFIKGIELLINNKNLRESIAENAYYSIRKILDWDISISKFEDYLKKLLCQKNSQ
ncbi:MAG: glycosyltransferase family 4 protein [Ignavibacteria bacterium]|nr:glycosyltransferase family 4 protein [Ignavibacteria bacterium]